MHSAKPLACLSGIIFCLLCACTSASVPADPVPPAVLDTWHALREAILDGDAEAAGALARFPLKSIDYTHDKVVDAGALRARFDAIFEPKLVELIDAEQCAAMPGNPGYEVDCANGYMILGFEDTGSGYRWTYFGSINE